MGDTKARVVFDDLSGGMNVFDPPWKIAKNECADALNLDFYKSPCGRKRNGKTSAAFTGVGAAAAEQVVQLYRHVPGTDDTLAEAWMVNNQATPSIRRCAGGVAFAAPTLKDAPTGTGYDFTFASINGKLFVAYKTAVDRLHVWDGSTVRRAGLAASAAPTAADGVVAGAYPAVLRYYRQRSTRQSGGITLGRSEPSASVSFTPNGAFTTAVVTQAAVINEGETHWEVEASIDNITFYRIATVVIGTTTYADSALVATYNTNPLSASTGFYTLQKSYKFIAADKNRLLGFANFTSTNKQSRVEYSAIIGSSDISDEERVDTTTNYFGDLDELDSGVPTGLRGPVDGSYFAFKERQTWEGVATGSPLQPFRWDALSKSIGAVYQVAIDRGEDKDGNAALYWMSHRGAYMWTKARGMRYLTRNIEPYVLGDLATINLGATVIARTLYYPDKRQVWMWWATGSSTSPDVMFVLDAISGGWTRWLGDVASSVGIQFATAACMFSNTPGAAMSKDLKPYMGRTSGAGGAIDKADTGTDDNTIGFQAYVVTRDYEPGGPGFYGEVGDATLLAAKSTGVTVSMITTGDFGLQTGVTATMLLTASAAGEAYLSQRLQGSALAGDIQFIHHQIGDAIAIASGFNLGRLVVPVAQRGPVGQ